MTMADTLAARDPSSRPRYFRNLFEECIFIFTVMMSTASTTFLQGCTIINTATIGTHLAMTPAQITWIAAALGLGSGSFMLLFGKTADLFGRKIQLLGGMVFLAIISLVTAYAQNAMAMDILCGFLGLGTAVISPPAIGIMMATYPEGQRRNFVMGALGCGNPVGFILGSMSSGLVSKYFNWRASFIVVAVFFFFMALLSTWTVPSMPRTDKTSTIIKQFDYLGTALIVVGMAAVSAALTGGPEYGWANPRVIVPVIIGCACLIGFGVWENISKHPLLSPAVWKNKSFSLCVLCVFFGYMSFITNEFWIALYMQKIQHFSALEIAVRLLPQALIGILWSYMGQALISRLSGRAVLGIGGIGYLVGASLLIFMRPDTSYWALLFPSLCITVVGADFQFIASNLYVSQQMPDQSSLAAGVLQTAMRLSISFGLAITTAVYGTVTQTQRGAIDTSLPFQRAYLCSMIFAFVGLLFVPLIKIGTQGRKELSLPVVEDVESVHGAVTDQRSIIKSAHSDNDREWRRIEHKSSETSLWSAATMGSVDNIFPRWSWETNKEISKQGYRNEVKQSVIYEVCLKCLEERKVVLHYGNRNSNDGNETTVGTNESLLAALEDHSRNHDFSRSLTLQPRYGHHIDQHLMRNDLPHRDTSFTDEIYSNTLSRNLKDRQCMPKGLMGPSPKKEADAQSFSFVADDFAVPKCAQPSSGV